MTMERRSGNRLPTNLPQLQNLIKRDKKAYRDEVTDVLRVPVKYVMTPVYLWTVSSAVSAL